MKGRNKTGGMRRKGAFPEKTCPACGRSFAWRRKWAGVWDRVIYCSQACRNKPKPHAENAG